MRQAVVEAVVEPREGGREGERGECKGEGWGRSSRGRGGPVAALAMCKG